MNVKPNHITDTHLKYLDDLRESSVTNMYGAGIYLEQEFNLSTKIADEVLHYWIESFEERHPEDL